MDDPLEQTIGDVGLLMDRRGIWYSRLDIQTPEPRLQDHAATPSSQPTVKLHHHSLAQPVGNTEKQRVDTVLK